MLFYLSSLLHAVYFYNLFHATSVLWYKCFPNCSICDISTLQLYYIFVQIVDPPVLSLESYYFLPLVH